MSSGKKVLDVDYLDEDPVISGQTLYLLSYVLSDDTEKKTTMIKIRGAFKDKEACDRRVKFLQSQDEYFDIVIGEVGKWSPLLSREELASTSEVDVEYREENLQKIMKNYKKNQDDSNLVFSKRKQEMQAKAQEEGSKDGQLKLAEEKEEPVVIISRIRDYEGVIAELQGRIDEVLLKKQQDQDLMKTYSQEAIDESIRKYEEYAASSKK